ncbi:hypothetical protein [Caudoviricetes sp.]|nr:hypothetical protein [Caudoviricetes sp.]
MTEKLETRTIDLGNGESLTRGVFKNDNGTFLALGFTASKVFKTEKGAIAWLKKRGA